MVSLFSTLQIFWQWSIRDGVWFVVANAATRCIAVDNVAHVTRPTWAFNGDFHLYSSVHVLFCSFVVFHGYRSLLVNVSFQTFDSFHLCIKPSSGHWRNVDMQKAVRLCPGYMLTAPTHRMHLKLYVHRKGLIKWWVRYLSLSYTRRSLENKHSYRKRMWKWLFLRYVARATGFMVEYSS
jgi:hypothetical protein